MSTLSKGIGATAIALALVYSSTMALQAAGSDESTKGGLQISIATDPNPLRVGTDRVEVTVRNAGGQLANDASVVIRTSIPVLGMTSPMPMQGMGRAAETLIARSLARGRYGATIHVPKVATLRIVVHVISNGVVGAAFRDAMVH